MPCAKYTTSSSCSAENDRCEYDSDAKLCKNIGQELDCKLYIIKSGCNAKSGCEYDDAALACKREGEILPCNKFYQKESCTGTGRCYFDSDSNICFDHGVKPPCKIFRAAVSTEDQSHWAAGLTYCL